MGDADRDEIKKIVGKKYPHAAIHTGSKAARRFALEFAKAHKATFECDQLLAG
jgi:hypothetical protein